MIPDEIISFTDKKVRSEILETGVKEALIKSLSYFAISIIMQDKEKDDENSELFKESFDAVLYNYAAK